MNELLLALGVGVWTLASTVVGYAMGVTKHGDGDEE